MKIKICGITRPSDAEIAVGLGATHIGCVMVPESPRCVTPSEAKEIFSTARAARRGTTCMLVCWAEDPAIVQRMAKEAGTKAVQLHQYREPVARELEGKGLSVCRVFEVPTGTNLLPLMTPAPTKKHPGMLDVAGGTAGLTFPWELLGSEAPEATFISGGVRPENVCALLTHKPYGIDVSSGVEREPGIKDADRLVMLFDSMAAARK